MNNPRYRILRELGGGTHGSVTQAEDITRSGRLVAIKAVHGSFPADEVTHLATLRHKAIPRLYEVFCEGETWYLAMEYRAGVTLRQHLRESLCGLLPLGEVQRIGLQLCSVLDYLHERGIIYRDLTPINVLIDRNGHLSLVDFSTATTHGPYEHAGSRRYAAPEQQRPGELDPRADIYSLGVVLHELLTGSISPLEATEPVEGLAMNEQTVAMRRLLLALMEVDPNKRPQGIMDVVRALLRI